jgi:spore coat polysaccharide biosynthesis predicted glycosyltransferase SpsG
LIRFEVASRRRDAAIAERDGSVVVARGGSDPLDIGASLVGELQIGGIAARMAGGLFGTDRYPSPDQLAEWFARSGVAVVGAGSSLWELACLGTPTVAVVVADNQLSLAESAEEAGLVKAIDARRGIRPQEIASIVAQLLSDRVECDEMGKRGQALVDGLGAARVVSGILQTLNHET